MYKGQELNLHLRSLPRDSIVSLVWTLLVLTPCCALPLAAQPCSSLDLLIFAIPNMMFGLPTMLLSFLLFVSFSLCLPNNPGAEVSFNEVVVDKRQVSASPTVDVPVSASTGPPAGVSTSATLGVTPTVCDQRWHREVH